MSAKINIGVIFNAVNRTGSVMGRINGQVNRLESRVQSFNSKVNSLFSVGNMIGVGAGLGFLKLGADMEQNNVAFKVMLGSADKAVQVMNKLNNFSNITPFQNKEVIAAGRNLIAFGVEADNLEATLQRVGDVASGVRMPFTELSEIYGKIKVSNTVFNEDLNQLAGRGIPIFEELAKVMGVPQSKIKKLSSEGKITFKEIDQAFKNMTSGTGKYAGMMDEMSKTAGGSWSTALGKLLDGVTRLSVSVMPIMTDMLNGIIPVIDKFNEFSQAHPELLKNILLVGGGLMGLNIAGKVFGVLRAGALVASSGILQPVGAIFKFTKAARLMNLALKAGKLETYSSLIARYGTAGRIAAGGIWLKNKAVSFGVFVGKLWNAETRKGMILQARQTVVSKLQAAWTWIVSKAQMFASGVTALWGKRMVLTAAIQAGWNKIMALSKLSLGSLLAPLGGVIASTWAWTAALFANPIVWITALVIGLVGAILMAWKHFDWFRGGIVAAWETVKQFGKILFDSIVNPIQKIIAGIKKLMQAFQLLKKKDFSGAWKITKEGFGDIGKGMIQSTPVGVIKNVVDRRGEIADANRAGWAKGKAIDTSNFLYKSKKKDNPLSVKNMQTPVPGVMPIDGKLNMDMPEPASMQIPGMMNMDSPVMKLVKVPGTMDTLNPKANSVRVPGAMDTLSPKVNPIQVPGIIKMYPPEMQAVQIPGLINKVSPTINPVANQETNAQVPFNPIYNQAVSNVKRTNYVNAPEYNNLDQVTKNITQNIVRNEAKTENQRNLQNSKIEVTYSPQVNISAELTEQSRDNLMEMLRKDKDELMRLINEEQRKERRLNYAG